MTTEPRGDPGTPGGGPGAEPGGPAAEPGEPGGPLVVKIGGGLLRERGLPGLAAACADVRALARDRPVLVVPGGGPFADAVRDLDARLALGDDIAHELALGAMDQLGLLLGAWLSEAPRTARLTAPARDLTRLAVHAALADRPEIPRSWAVTSDSLAVLAAGAVGAAQAVLLKPVVGILARWPSAGPPLPSLTAAELERLQTRGGGGAVDRWLGEAVRRTGVTVVVRAPGARDDSGTRITPA